MMICNLSAPKGNSINELIDPQLCTVHYSTFDEAVNLIHNVGQGALLAKKDISNAFRLFQVRPENFSLLGFTLEGKFYTYKCLPIGCSISCSLFEKIQLFLQLSLATCRTQVPYIIHYI
jgi:hypothetical protein